MKMLRGLNLYLCRARQAPRTLDDLSRHVGIKCSAGQNGSCQGFDFHAAGQLAKVKLDRFLQIDDEHGCLLAGIQGVGLPQPSRLAAVPYLRSGQLRDVLPAWLDRSTALVNRGAGDA
jgi:LysR family transcriptional regulator, regulator for bpeEF and oprC